MTQCDDKLKTQKYITWKSTKKYESDVKTVFLMANEYMLSVKEQA